MALTPQVEAPVVTRQTAARLPGRFTRGDVVALAAILALLLAELAILHVGVDDLDEGYFAAQAARVIAGQVPYRDFDSFYTPGLLYLHALLFSLAGGPFVMLPRALSLVARAALGFGLYGVARTLTRPAFACLPSLFILFGLDAAPDMWEPHPGWLATVAVLGATALVLYLPVAPRSRRWLVLGATGVCLAVSFLVKQNTGAFAAAGTVGYLFLCGTGPWRNVPTRAAYAVGVAGVIALLGAIAFLILPFSDPITFAYLWLPLLAIGILLLAPSSDGQAWSSGRPTPSMDLRECAATVAPVIAGFAVTSLVWLAPLLASIHGNLDDLKSFVGDVNQAVLFSPIELPTFQQVPAVALGAIALLAIPSRASIRWALLAAAIALGAAMFWSTQGDGESAISALLQAPGRGSMGLNTLLPTAAVWAGLWLARHSRPALRAWRLRWCITAGSFLFLTQYPRLDTTHLIWSAPLLLVVGAFMLDRAHALLARRWQLSTPRGWAILYAALLVIPFLAALPTVYWRLGFTLLDENEDTQLPQPVPLVAITGVPAVNGLLVPSDTRDSIVDTVEAIRALTQPGEPIFVYPTAPLFYVAADRPNPTRFEHLYPGAATPLEIQQIIGTLGRDAVKVVVISDFWMGVWGPAGDNQPLESYIATHYHQVAQYYSYRILQRCQTGDVCGAIVRSAS